MVQQHEGKQTVDLRLVEDAGELTGHPDRFGRQVDVAAVALVEEEVQHVQDGGRVTGLVQSHPGDALLGAADPLCHGGFRHQIGVGDLSGGEARNGTQRQGDGRRRRQRRVCAQEVQP